MSHRKSKVWAAIALAAVLSACRGGGDWPLGGTGASTDPALETDQAVLDAALDCDEFTHPEHEPVLLIHGTGTYGQEQWNWSYRPWLQERGVDVCVVTYPDRGMGDQQISAEYVVNAVRSIHAASGRKVDMVGHSQGGSMPRWAIKWWPSVQAAVDDFVLLASPSHGTALGSGGGSGGGLQRPAATFQFGPDSNFITATNAGDETPGEIDYTSIYTLFDELVQPQAPVSTSTLEPGQENPHVTNILIQDVCVARPVDHVSIGLVDAATALLVLDAIFHPGPADVARAGGMSICTELFIVDPAIALQKMAELGPAFAGSIPPALHLVSEEPPLKPYATGE